MSDEGRGRELAYFPEYVRNWSKHADSSSQEHVCHGQNFHWLYEQL